MLSEVNNGVFGRYFLCDFKVIINKNLTMSFISNNLAKSFTLSNVRK